MSKVIFARPRHEYDSYNDLYRLIDLSGYPLIYADEIDPQSNNCYIVTLLNGETQNGWPGARAEIILWDLEWRVDDPPQVPGVSRVWASDMWYANEIGAQYVCMGSHSKLLPDRFVQFPLADGVPADIEPNSVAAMMYTGPYRRNRVIGELRERGVTVFDPAWGHVRDERLFGASAMLHIHQHDNVATIAPLRWALAAAYQMPVISERLRLAPPTPGTFWVDYERMADDVALILRHEDELSQKALELWQSWCFDYSFRVRVEAAL